MKGNNVSAKPSDNDHKHQNKLFVAAVGGIGVGGQAAQEAQAVVPELFYGGLKTVVPLQTLVAKGNLLNPLQLTYQSLTSNGWIGMGWTIDIDAIQCSLKPSLDYGSDNFVYHTTAGDTDLADLGNNEYRYKIESDFRRFQKLQAADGEPYWKATDKLGTVYIFGQDSSARQDDPSDSDTIFKWGLESIQDKKGNYLHIAYQKDGAVLYPSTITYGGNGGFAANKTIQFTLERRPDAETDFRLGFQETLNRRLSLIDILAGGQIQWRYSFNYTVDSDPGTSGRSLLKSVTKISTDSSTKYDVTSLEYQSPTTILGSTPWGNGPALQGAASDNVLTGNFRGDGFTDILVFNGNGHWTLYYPDVPHKAWITENLDGPSPGLPLRDQTVVGDFNGDGKTDIACYTGSGGKWHVACFNSTGWDATYWDGGPSPSHKVGDEVRVGDFNGDGLTDLIWYRGSGTWTIYSPTGHGWTSRNIQGPSPGLPIGNQTIVGDINGDGKDDICCWTGVTGRWDVSLSQPTGEFFHSYWDGGPSPTHLTDEVLTGDFNGDGRMNLLWFRGNGLWTLYIPSDGTWVHQDRSGPNPALPVRNQTFVGDFNGDGKADIACYTGSGGKWHMALSNATGWDASRYYDGPAPSLPLSDSTLVGDFNGDGISDIATYSGNNDTWQMSLSNGSIPDLLSKMTTLFGGTISFTYGSSTQNAASHRQLPFPIHVLSQIQYDNRVGATSQQSFDYYGGLYSIPSKDFRGFAKVVVTGPSARSSPSAPPTNLIRTVTFHQQNEADTSAIPVLKGQIDTDNYADDSGKAYYNISYNYTPIKNGPYYYWPITSLTRTSIEASTTPEKITHDYSYDDYGNCISEHTYGGTDNKHVDVTKRRSFAYNIDSWILACPNVEEVADNSTSGPHLLSKTLLLYDHHSEISDPPAIGNPSKIIKVLPERSTSVIWKQMWYDNFGNITKDLDALGNSTLYTYDRSGCSLIAKEDALGHTTTNRYYGINAGLSNRGLYGQLAAIEDVNHATTTFAYDSLGRKEEEKTPLGLTTHYNYNNIGSPGQENIETTNSLGIKDASFLDGFGYLVEKDTSVTSSSSTIKKSLYSPEGILLKSYLPVLSTDNASVAPEMHFYDVLNRETLLVRTDGSVVASAYAPWKIAHLDSLGRQRILTYDGLGRLIKTSETEGKLDHPDFQHNEYASISLVYDALNHIVSRSDKLNNQMLARFNGLGFKTWSNDPDQGAHSYTYDAIGNILTDSEANGITHHYKYDSLNRLIKKYSTRSLGDKTDNLPDIITYRYDEVTSANGIGRMTSAECPNYSIRYQYDKVGNIVSRDVSVDNKKERLQERFDSMGRRIELQADNHVIKYRYDGPVINDVVTDQAPVVRFTSFSPELHPTHAEYGNGAYEDWTYSPTTNRLSFQRLTESGSRPGSVAANYVYDTEGNILNINRGSLHNEKFEYDDQERLSHFSVDSQEFTFKYDPIGNLTYKTGAGNLYYFESGANSRLPHALKTNDGQVCSYDLVGNLVSQGDRLGIKYDEWSHPIEVTRGFYHAVYQYDPFGHRIYKLTQKVQDYGYQTREFSRESTHKILYLSSYAHISDGRLNLFTLVNNKRVELLGESSLPVFYHADRLGNLSCSTNEKGSVRSRYIYEPFGSVIEKLKRKEDPRDTFLFADREWDVGPDLYNFLGRLYDPKYGHFISADHSDGQPEVCVSFNKYAYANNNPSNFVDLSGDRAEPIDDIRETKSIGSDISSPAGTEQLNFNESVNLLGAEGGTNYELGQVDAEFRYMVEQAQNLIDPVVNFFVDAGTVGTSLVGLGLACDPESPTSYDTCVPYVSGYAFGYCTPVGALSSELSPCNALIADPDGGLAYGACEIGQNLGSFASTLDIGPSCDINNLSLNLTLPTPAFEFPSEFSSPSSPENLDNDQNNSSANNDDDNDNNSDDSSDSTGDGGGGGDDWDWDDWDD